MKERHEEKKEAKKAYEKPVMIRRGKLTDAGAAFKSKNDLPG